MTPEKAQLIQSLEKKLITRLDYSSYHHFATRWAARYGKVEVITYLAEKGGINMKRLVGTILKDMCKIYLKKWHRRQSEVLKYLLTIDGFGKATPSDKSLQSLLKVSIRSRNFHCLDFLLTVPKKDVSYIITIRKVAPEYAIKYVSRTVSAHLMDQYQIFVKPWKAIIRGDTLIKFDYSEDQIANMKLLNKRQLIRHAFEVNDIDLVKRIINQIDIDTRECFRWILEIRSTEALLFLVEECTNLPFNHVLINRMKLAILESSNKKLIESFLNRYPDTKKIQRIDQLSLNAVSYLEIHYPELLHGITLQDILVMFSKGRSDLAYFFSKRSGMAVPEELHNDELKFFEFLLNQVISSNLRISIQIICGISALGNIDAVKLILKMCESLKLNYRDMIDEIFGIICRVKVNLNSKSTLLQPNHVNLVNYLLTSGLIPLETFCDKYYRDIKLLLKTNNDPDLLRYFLSTPKLLRIILECISRLNDGRFRLANSSVEILEEVTRFTTPVVVSSDNRSIAVLGQPPLKNYQDCDHYQLYGTFTDTLMQKLQSVQKLKMKKSARSVGDNKND